MPMITRFTRMATGVVVLGSLIASLFVATPAQAYTLNPADFNPGLIISDAEFYDDNAMTEAEIQAFLNAKIPNCTNGKCLNVLRQDTVSRPATVIDALRPGSPALCSAYTGGTGETAARIIFKVQKACRISAKAILVTLQKEQGLVTATAPSDTKLKIAMGMGCPDTARCDSFYFGFFNQVYYGASQLRRYSNPASMYYRAPGSTASIGFHPNASCGSSRVVIANLATNALYRYTPYQPNAAALANLWGTGNSCSAYGNRNFWRNYNSWFNLKAELKSQVAALPATTRTALGSIVSETACVATANTCTISYQTGVVSLPLLGKISVTLGAIGTAFQQSGGVAGPLGAVVTAQETIAAGANGTGLRQQFANGYIYHGPAGAPVIVLTPIHTVYMAQGGAAGTLGWPKSAQRCATTRCDQRFDGGLIAPNSAAALTAILGRIGLAYGDSGGVNSPWGAPTANRAALTITGHGAGFKQTFQNGTAYDNGTAASYLSSQLHPALAAVGGEAATGWPTGTMQVSGTTRYQQFSGGILFGSTANSTGILMPPAVVTAWTAAGGAAGYLGLPTTADAPVSGPSGSSGKRMTFVGGFIVTGTPGTFAHPTAINTTLTTVGGLSGSFGWPTAHARNVNGVWSQTFQGGTISLAPATTRPTIKLGARGTHVVYLQQKLRIRADGIFGTGTRSAVIAFQRSKRLVADGIVGPATWRALEGSSTTATATPTPTTPAASANSGTTDTVSRPTIRVGARGPHVIYLQQKLRVAADGVFGTGTRNAVIGFQRSKGLIADGVVGPRTWAALG
jgi:peptidoglycan hydrolase-like protein with peptidoglycan-binding domain